MYKLNDVLLSVYGIIPGRYKGEGIAVKGVFDLPKRIGKTHYDWGDEDSIEPYVDADEIMLGGRDLFFAGIIQGTRPEVETLLDDLRLAINAFPDRVIFETPYGSFCVYIKKMLSKFYRDGATLTIQFREPDITSDCEGGIPPPPITTYYSNDVWAEVERNDCNTGYYGSLERLYASESDQFPFESTESQAGADKVAMDWVLSEVHNYANANGTCTINPTMYYNVRKTGELARDNCGVGYTGSIVEWVVDAGEHSSDVSQAVADQLAQDEIDANLTQAYANANGSCVLDNVATGTVYSNTHTGPGGIRTMIFEIGPAVVLNAVYKLTVYSVTAEYTALFGDTTLDVVNGLISAVNGKTENDWNAQNSAPNTGTPGFKPFAYNAGASENLIVVELNYQNQFAFSVVNP